jgi:transposase
VTEWRLHARTCAACGSTTRATLLPEAALAFGPRLHAALALLVGRFRLSHGSVPELLREVFGIAISDGAVSDGVQRVSEALAAPVAQAAEAARAQPVAHLDETGWRMGRRRAWLWVMATALATIFLSWRRTSWCGGGAARPSRGSRWAPSGASR